MILRMMKKKKIVVIGGGPAGMMAAIRAAQCGARVVLLEKTERLGKKLRLTGKGRCNVTNACRPEEFFQRFFHNGKFLRDALREFSNEDLMAFFRGLGVPLKIERQQRVFPESDRASSIVQALGAALKREGVSVRLKSPVAELDAVQDRVTAVVFADKSREDADAVIIATGGISYPGTGSTGDGMRFARQTGHGIVPLRPALVGLKTAGRTASALEGLTLKNIRLEFQRGQERRIRTDIGELLFTARGISGPLVVTYSGMIAGWLADGVPVFVRIDLKPALTADDLERRLLQDFQNTPRMQMKNFLKNLLPKRMIAIFLNLGKIDSLKSLNQISQKERRQMVQLLKAFPLEISGTESVASAMVTQGGVVVKDVDPRTMRSRRITNLYFAGEVLDIDGDTGGFNLQAAFSTGFLAGQSSVKKEKQ